MTTYKLILYSLRNKLSTFESIGHYQSRLNSYKEDRRKKQNELTKISGDIGRLETERDRQASERDRLALQSDDNKKIAVYKTYAERILEILTDEYSKRRKRSP